jgi:histone H3/H4
MNYGGIYMTKRLLPLAAMESIMKKAGADRVSDKAKEALKEYLEKTAEEITKNALQFAEAAKRNTLKDEDIERAVKLIIK